MRTGETGVHVWLLRVAEACSFFSFPLEFSGSFPNGRAGELSDILLSLVNNYYIAMTCRVLMEEACVHNRWGGAKGTEPE